MSITAEYRRVTADQLTWFTKKPSALYQLLSPDSIEVPEDDSHEPKAKSVWGALADFQAFTQAMQNPGTNDALIISKLPSMLGKWRAMAGEEATQQLLSNLAERNSAIADFLKKKPRIAERPKEDRYLLNIEKAWDGIHFVLTASKEPFDSLISRAIFGDRVIPDELGIMGYGPARVLTAAQVSESANELRRLQPELSTRFDIKSLVAAKVYAVHDDSEELSYLTYHYDRLLRFYEEAASEQHAMAVYMV